LLSTLPNQYDLVHLGDVLEHFPKATGLDLVRQCYARARMGVIIVTPCQPEVQGAWHGNAYETHRSAFHPRDFSHYAFRLSKIVRDGFQPGRAVILLAVRPLVISQWGPTSGLPLLRRVREWWLPNLRSMGRQLPLPPRLRQLLHVTLGKPT
jgi:hypothetical protein